MSKFSFPPNLRIVYHLKRNLCILTINSPQSRQTLEISNIKLIKSISMLHKWNFLFCFPHSSERGYFNPQNIRSVRTSRFLFLLEYCLQKSWNMEKCWYLKILDSFNFLKKQLSYHADFYWTIVIEYGRYLCSYSK